MSLCYWQVFWHEALVHLLKGLALFLGGLCSTQCTPGHCMSNTLRWSIGLTACWAAAPQETDRGRHDKNSAQRRGFYSIPVEQTNGVPPDGIL